MCTGSGDRTRTVVEDHDVYWEIAAKLSHCMVFFVGIFFVAAAAVQHVLVHQNNSCSMTYMYRRLQFLELPMVYGPTNKYTLSVYNEGYHWWNHSSITPGQIPVLFIPGSQGSAKQVRSLASLMQNKTESRRSPFSFRFFAVDFDEEMTFMNGNIMTRQLDYVMHALKYIKKMMKVQRKVILVGHSYGGVLALLTTLHPEHFEDSELIILKGSPINKQPIINDWLTLRLTRFLSTQWDVMQIGKLQRIGVVAYSGGLRDFQIPDGWSVLKNITHRPLWAIDEVSDLGCDHLAILWCNEFVRHVSRLLFSYAENLKEKSGREIVHQFYKAEVDRNIKRANLTQRVSLLPTVNIKLGTTYKNLELKDKQTVLLLQPKRYQVLWVKVNASCVNTMTTVRQDESLMHFQNATDGVVETWIYRATFDEKVRLVLDTTPSCKVDIQMSSPLSVHVWRFYEMVFSHLIEVGGVFIVVSVFFAMILRERLVFRHVLAFGINIFVLLVAYLGSIDANNNLMVPMATGYYMALVWWFAVSFIDSLVFSRFPFIEKTRKWLVREDQLFNGIFLVCGAITVMSSSEGIIALILLLSFRHDIRAVFLAIPALLPHVLKVAGFPLFTLDNQSYLELQYHPAFYAACIYLWGLMSNKNFAQVTMRCLIYGLSPALLYLISAPLELFSAYALLVLTAARFVTYDRPLTLKSVVQPEQSNRQSERRQHQQENRPIVPGRNSRNNRNNRNSRRRN